MDMPNVAPSVRVRGAPALGLTTEPEPSISGWRLASVTIAKRSAAGAGNDPFDTDDVSLHGVPLCVFFDRLGTSTPGTTAESPVQCMHDAMTT